MVHCGMTERRLHHRRVQKDVVISIASHGDVVSTFDVSFRLDSRLVQFARISRSCAPRLYLTHSTA